MARLDDAQRAWVAKLVGQRRPGYALEQAFYADPKIFLQDVERIVFSQWLLAGHISRIPSPGDYFLFEIGGESVIVIRGRDGEIRALLNVCRHRGSRVCVQAQGNAKSLVCPYHAWSYSTDGALIGARTTPPDFDRSTFGLHRLHLRVHEGLIFISFADRPLDLDPAAREMAAFLGPHDLEHAKIATRKTYPVAANWKLVLENFYECYHCAPAHREYCSANPSAHHFDQGPRGQRYAALLEKWNERAEGIGHKTGDAHSDLTSLPDSVQYYGFSRGPLEPGYQTQSEDGKPVAPLMGHLKEYDGGETQSGIGPLASVLGYSDYALMFQFLPISVTRTEVEVTWLVAESAREGVDYELERLVWLWDVTTQQDTKITEDNQLGVNSHFYQPGPYTDGESTTASFTDWYLRRIA